MTWGLRAVVGVAAVALLSAFPAGATNSAQYTDPAEGGTAPDVVDVRVANDDNATVNFAITIQGKNLLGAGDYVFTLIDFDRNPSTGDPELGGADYYLVAVGPVPFQYSMCTWSGSWNCVGHTTAFDEAVSATSHRLRMTERFNKTSTFSFNFWVITAYEDPATKAQTFDRAPNSGTWTYEARITTDVDGDGLRPPADKCPTVAGGRYDSNRNGCPGPFPLIKPHFSGQVVAEGRRTKVSLLTVDNLPPGARVVLTGARKRVSLVANGAGEVATAGFRSKVFPARNLIEARITKPGWVGYYGVLSPRTLRPVVKQCIPATGSQTPVPCSAALRGR